ncbi:MAG: tyrosine--tRNA ligase, partial [Candidatus Aminicenantes bacterium]|nr:tyrosine--tRNA ligase [Candidatus Aminicenantes bacterium]
FWGEREAEKAAEEFERVFKNKELPTEIEEIAVKSAKTLLVDLLVDKNIFPSRGEAKRVIRQGGVYLDGQRIEDIQLNIEMKKQSESILKIGKKKFYRLKKV